MWPRSQIHRPSGRRTDPVEGTAIAGWPCSVHSNTSAPGWPRSTKNSAFAHTANPLERNCERMSFAKTHSLGSFVGSGGTEDSRKTFIIALSGAKSAPRCYETRRRLHSTSRALERSGALPRHRRNLRSSAALSLARAPSSWGTNCRQCSIRLNRNSSRATGIHTGRSRCCHPCSTRPDSRSSCGKGTHFGRRRARRCCRQYPMLHGQIEYRWRRRVPANRKRSNRRADLPSSSVPCFLLKKRCRPMCSSRRPGSRTNPTRREPGSRRAGMIRSRRSPDFGRHLRWPGCPSESSHFAT
jgi:hypothetical protein